MSPDTTTENNKPELKTPLVSKVTTNMKTENTKQTQASKTIKGKQPANKWKVGNTEGNDELNDAEAKKLDACEKRIASAGESYVIIGKALETIKLEGLYRAKFGTLEAYGESVWGYSRSQCSRFVIGAKIHADVASSGPDAVLPTTESMARLLARIPKDKRAQAMSDAKAKAGAGRLLTAHVQQAVDVIRPPKVKVAATAKKKFDATVVLRLVGEAKQLIDAGGENKAVVEKLTEIETAINAPVVLKQPTLMEAAA